MRGYPTIKYGDPDDLQEQIGSFFFFFLNITFCLYDLLYLLEPVCVVFVFYCLCFIVYFVYFLEYGMSMVFFLFAKVA